MSRCVVTDGSGIGARSWFRYHQMFGGLSRLKPRRAA
jgi:hypothetical protein